ncbi:MAG: phosphotransferase [Candidatus Latescibacterota bacterium]|nr:MAG: phosphotransferase [Candidatus Latescibacterota bacterium]
MGKQRGIQIVTDGLEHLPVVGAWCALQPGRVPQRVEILRQKRSVKIARLPGVGREGSDVIAKRCERDVALVEREIYDELLPRLPVDALTFYGFAEAQEENLAWLFVEDARGIEFAPNDPEHCAVATRWLASLHTRATTLATTSTLPDRGLQWYLQNLREARETIQTNFNNPALTAADRALLDRSLFRFDDVESRWTEVEAAIGRMPSTLVHGDIAERNVHLRRNGNGLSLLVFDWEVSGWGPPAVDLMFSDVGLYWLCVRDTWPDLDVAALHQQVHLGKLLRGGLAASNWVAGALCTRWVETAVRNLSIYFDRMSHSMRALGWLD